MTLYLEIRDWMALVAVSILIGIGIYAVFFAQPPLGHSTQSTAKAIASFEKLVTVLQSPRCMNCHRSDVPRVRDDARPHVPRVEPGTDGRGVGGLRCVICHRAGNNDRSRIPGAVAWQQAPYSMSWDGLAAADICDNLKDRSMNGDRTLADLKIHFAQDHLVQWAWAPGNNRTTPPLAYDIFLDHVSTWIDGGAPCPKPSANTPGR